MNIALLLAGGVGMRASCQMPKQFIEVNNKPLIVYTMEKFQQSEYIDRICVVCLDKWIPKVREFAEKFEIEKLDVICEGGNSGLESLQNGLNALNCKEEDLIVIHDAVRPFVDEQIIEDNIRVAKQNGIAVAAIDCVETLVYAEESGYAEKMLSRDNLKRVQTPQTFQYGILTKLFESVDISKVKEPSVFALYMSLGNSIYCSRGSEKNIKITYPEDIEYFRNLFQAE